MIETYHLSKLYNRGVYALRDLSLTIDKGEFLFLTGPSGAGKSTFLRLLLCEEVPSDGRLSVSGRNLTELSPPQIQSYRRSIGFVAAGILVASIAPIGLAFAFFEGIRSFSNASIFAFSAAGYALMAVSYLLFARRLRAAVWFAPFWPLSHIPAAVMTLAEMRRLSRLHTESREPIRKAHTFL